MKKRWFAYLLAAVMMTGMTACGSNGATDLSVTDTAQEEGSSLSVDSASDEDGQGESEGEMEGESEGYAFGDADEENRGPGLLSVHTSSMFDSEWSDEYDKLLASATYSVVELGGESAAAFPALAESLQELNEQKKFNSEETYEEVLTFAREDIQNDTDNYTEHQTTETVAVRRADTRVLSLLYENLYYAGGAHGSYFYFGENFDTKTGKKLKLADVVTDMDALPALVSEQLDIYYGEVGFYDDLNLEEYFRDSEQEISWTLDYNGITIFFNPYDIAPYASGVQNVTILFADHPDLFAMQYQNAADRYAVQLSFEKPYYFDVNSDGTEEVILVSGATDEYGAYATQSISVNEHWYEDEIYTYSIDPVFFHTADGNSYLYIQNSLDNDWRMITVYDLTSGDVEKVDSVYAGWHDIIADGPVYYPIQDVITDPEQFVLDIHTELLSTQTGSRWYSVGENGMPVSDQKWYDLTMPIDLTLKQDLDVTLVDSKTGEELGTRTVGTGTVVQYFRTDNEKYAYLLLPDHTIARIEVEIVDWERSVQGTSIYDLFDGIIFAG